MGIKFNHYKVNSRKDLLDFISDKQGNKVYKEIGKNPEAWIDELGLIYPMLADCGLTCSSGIFAPPFNDKKFRKLGEKAYLYRGNEINLSGLWLFKGKDIFNKSDWEHYNLGGRASISLNSEFKISHEKLLPENFEKIASIKRRTRPIMKFKIDDIDVYAKGAHIIYSLYHDYARPKYRLTNFRSINKMTSKGEMEKTIEMANAGIKTSRVIGYYEALCEEFFFLEGVNGKSPKKCLQSHRREIIKQDAEMLAILCSLGYNKQGFADFDDKIFDGKNLHLIDVDETIDLYAHDSTDYRKILMNPNDAKKLKKFRGYQNAIFKQKLKDAIYEYQEDMLKNPEDKKAYINAFYKKMRWAVPSSKEIKNLTTFPRNYITYERNINMMLEE